MALSAMARLVRQGAFEKWNTGKAGPRGSAKDPSVKGFARGSLGTYGSRKFQGRNSDAGEMKERDFMNSPVFQKHLKAMTRRTG